MNRCLPDEVRRATAFTLLELLLAMAVFAVVITAVNTVFFGALRLSNKSQATLDRALPLHQALAVIRRDLRGLRPPPADTNALFSGEFQNTSEPSTVLASFGVRVTPDLYTTTGAIDEFTPFANVQKVAYFLVNPTNNTEGFELTRVISRDLAPVNEETFDQQFLMEGVANVQLQFFDGSVWTDVWDSTVSSNLPSAVRVQLLLATNAQAYLNAPIELVVPILADVLTNTVTTTTTTDDSGGGGGGGNNNGGGNTGGGGGGGGNTGGGGGGGNP